MNDPRIHDYRTHKSMGTNTFKNRDLAFRKNMDQGDVVVYRRHNLIENGNGMNPWIVPIGLLGGGALGAYATRDLWRPYLNKTKEYLHNKFHKARVMLADAIMPPPTPTPIPSPTPIPTQTPPPTANMSIYK